MIYGDIVWVNFYTDSSLKLHLFANVGIAECGALIIAILKLDEAQFGSKIDRKIWNI